MPDGRFRRRECEPDCIRGDQPMTRSTGVATGACKIDVTQAEHEIARIEDDPLDIVFAIQTIDAPDELDVRWTPRRVGASQFLILSASPGRPVESFHDNGKCTMRLGTFIASTGGRLRSSSCETSEQVPA